MSAEAIERLNRDFAGDHACFGMQGALACLRIRNGSAEAEIALQGAHLFRYARHGEAPVIWCSDASAFEPGEAIRGGIPVCWPWFGPHRSDGGKPNHGFARTEAWSVESVFAADPDATVVTMRLRDTEATRRLWPYRFELGLEITVGPTLQMALSTTNLDDVPFHITEALHTYFAVSDISATRIEGLETLEYLDKCDGKVHEQTQPLEIADETDRIYFEAPQMLGIEDAQRTLQLLQKGAADVVVWNPWARRAAEMGDMAESGYRRMVCVESANVHDDGLQVLPGKTHTLFIRIG